MNLKLCQCKAIPQKEEKYCVSCGLEFYENDQPRFFGLGSYDLSAPKQSFSERQATKLERIPTPFLLLAFAFFMALAISGAQGLLELLF